MNTNETSFSNIIERELKNYIENSGGYVPDNFYDFIMEQVELPLLKVMMSLENNNQTQMSKKLGLSRGTLKMKLKKFNLVR